MIFRIDDVSLNTDIDRLDMIIKTIWEKFPEAKIMLAVSLIVFDIIGEKMNPGILNTRSDYKEFYKGHRLGIPDLRDFARDMNIQIVSHGFIHVDHRLLTYSLVEWNIIQSCNIICPTNEHVFIPPYHKWDSDVEDVCEENDIELIKVEDGWTHLKFHKYGEKNYFHTFDFETMIDLEKQL